jgi:hypothetical protein
VFRGHLSPEGADLVPAGKSSQKQAVAGEV